MRTDDLTEMLARNAAVEAVPNTSRLWTLAAAAGAVVALALMTAWLGVQPHLTQMLATPAWWAKFGFAAAMGAIGLAAAMRLARPGADARWLALAALTPVVLLWIAGALQLADAPAARQEALILGHSWKQCPWRVAALSIPAFVAALAAFRQMAPTRLRLAGGAAGLFAGGVGAAVYALHCPELAPAFVGVWYVLGIAIPTAVGLLIGPRVLRW